MPESIAAISFAKRATGSVPTTPSASLIWQTPRTTAFTTARPAGAAPPVGSAWGLGRGGWREPAGTSRAGRGAGARGMARAPCSPPQGFTRQPFVHVLRIRAKGAFPPAYRDDIIPVSPDPGGLPM